MEKLEILNRVKAIYRLALDYWNSDNEIEMGAIWAELIAALNELIRDLQKGKGE